MSQKKQGERRQGGPLRQLVHLSQPENPGRPGSVPPVHGFLDASENPKDLRHPQEPRQFRDNSDKFALVQPGRAGFRRQSRELGPQGAHLPPGRRQQLHRRPALRGVHSEEELELE